MDRRLLGAMKAFTSSVLVAVLSIVLLATHVATQIPSDCHAEFLLEVADLYSNDQSCARALAALVTSTTSDPCSASDKDTIGDCLKKYRAEWLEFEEDCEETVTGSSAPAPGPTPSVTGPSVAPASSPAEAPESTPTPVVIVDAATPSPEEPPAAEESPETAPAEPSAISPSAEAETQLEQDGDSNPASAPAPAARRLRKLLATESAQAARRGLLEESTSTCAELFEEEGFSAFADLTRNGASSVELSVLSLAGSVFLGMMLL